MRNNASIAVKEYGIISVNSTTLILFIGFPKNCKKCFADIITKQMDIHNNSNIKIYQNYMLSTQRVKEHNIL